MENNDERYLDGSTSDGTLTPREMRSDIVRALAEANQSGKENIAEELRNTLIILDQQLGQ